MFCVISKPIIEAHAIAGELAAGIFFVLASIASYLGITFATNQDAQKALSDWFYGLGDDLKEFIEYAADTWVSGYNTIYDWTYNSWYQIAQSCRDFFKKFEINEGDIYCDFDKVSNPDGYIGFTPDTAISFTVPGFPSNTGYVHYTLPKGQWVFFQNSTVRPTGNSNRSGHYIYSSSVGLTGYSFTGEPGGSHWYITGDPGNYYYDGRGGQYQYYIASLSCDGCIFSSYTDNNGNVYYPQSASEFSPFTLVSNSGLVYTSPDGKSVWSNRYEFGKWFLSSCGFVVKSSDITDGTAGVYVPGSTNDDVKVDTDRLNEKVGEAESTKDVDGTISTVIPGTQEYLDEMAANPDLVTDVAAEGVYNADFPAVKSDPLLWQTKFPFCIPWDIYNLFAGFFTTSQCPTFTFILLPENSFGFGNDEITFTIDFSEYNTIVQIIRFFLAVFFVYGLIFATRKLVWSGG